MEDLSKFLTKNMNDPMRSNHVLAVVKPGFDSLLGTLCDLFKDNGYEIVKTKTTKLSLADAKQLYKVHSKEDFYDDLCEYMASGLTTAFILKKKTPVFDVFKDFEKLKEKIREEYGESDMRNVLHSSDSYKSFTHEAGIYFYNVNQEDLLK